MRVIKKWVFVVLIGLSQSLIADVMEVPLHYVGPTQGSVWQGVQQGLDEANIQGEFLGQKYTLQVITAEALMALDSAAAILLATDEEHILAIAQSDKFAHVAVFNLISDADALRTACLDNLLSIPASNKMKQDALAQWLAKYPNSKAHVQGWHEDFKKFAASQLNIRFKKSHGVMMDNDAWSGWAAVKLLSDTVARTQNVDPAVMLNYLRNDIAFDGQKGAGATFRDTGQLRQLVLLVEDNKIVAEAPLRGVKGGLDSLGLTNCK